MEGETDRKRAKVRHACKCVTEVAVACAKAFAALVSSEACEVLGRWVRIFDRWWSSRSQ